MCARKILSYAASRYDEFTPQCFNNLGNGIELRITAFRQGFVQARSRYSGLFGYFGHALGARGGVQGVDQVGRVACLRGFPQEFADVFVGFKTGCTVKFVGFNGHFLISKHFKDYSEFFNVFGLAAFVTDRLLDHTAIKNRVINRDTAVEETAQFKQIIFDGFVVTEIAIFNSVKTGKQLVPRGAIQLLEPFTKYLCR